MKDKVLLHIHLDGSVRKNTIEELTCQKIDVCAKEKCKDLNEYLEKFNIPISLMQTKENLIRVASELVEDLEHDNVVYAEIRFAPLLHTTILTPEEVIEYVLIGLKGNIKTKLILCMMRGMSFEDNLRVVELCSKYNCALDLAGAEGLYKTYNYKELFDIATKKNIPFTIHAGEADGAESVRDAILFGAKRIGHGVRILENEEVINLAIKNNIVFEVCPTSNVQTDLVDIYQNHPIRKMIEKGLKVTVNTDNNTVSNITLSEEYNKLKKYLNFTDEELKKLNQNARESIFK